MADVFPKFIVEDGALIIAKCTYHHQLVNDKAKVKGGGWWVKEENRFILMGKSHDFGQATIEDIASCVRAKEVYSNRFRTHSIADEFEFYHRDENGLIKLN